MIHVVPALPEHIPALVPNIRQADIDEMEAGYSLTPQKAMEIGLKHSSQCWVGLVDGEPIAMAGVNAPSVLSDTAYPWMLGTHHLDREDVKIGFLIQSRKILRTMLQVYAHLENHVDARNTKAIAWLKWLGFTMDEAKPYGPAGLPFHHFEIRRP